MAQARGLRESPGLESQEGSKTRRKWRGSRALGKAQRHPNICAGRGATIHSVIPERRGLPGLCRNSHRAGIDSLPVSTAPQT